MSIVLSIYSRNACKEFVLPAIRNAETVLFLDRKLYGLKDHIELRLEQDENNWYFLPSAAYRFNGNGIGGQKLRLEEEANYMLESANTERVFIIVQAKHTSFSVYDKYVLLPNRQISIGSSEEADISYSYIYNQMEYITKIHCMLQCTNQETVLQDKSKNGIFVNDVRVNGNIRLHFGDRIHIWGLNIVFLGNVLAIHRTIHTTIKRDVLPCWDGQTADAGTEQNVSKTLYHRAPRNLAVLETGVVEIEAPPTPKETPDTPLLMTVGPAMTMAIPMVLSSAMSVIGARSSGAYSGTFMYTGIITALSSALIGAVWAVNNIRYGKNKAKKEEMHRFEAYGEYLIKCTDEIKEKYEHNTQAMLKLYPSAEECASEEFERQNLLWERNNSHPDYLFHRLGIGDMPFQVKIEIPKTRFTLINDSLADKPKFIKESYQTLHQVPVCLNLLEERIIGVIGGTDMEGAYPIIYTLVTQIAAQNCYTDVKMAFAFKEEQGSVNNRWEFTKWLPHVWSQDKNVRFVAGNKSEASDIFYELTKIFRFRSEEQASHSGDKDIIYKPHYILFVEDISFLEGELLEKYIFDQEKPVGLTVVLMAEHYEDLPNTCECIIQNDNDFAGWYNIRTGERSEITFDHIDLLKLEAMARRQSCLEVKETEIGGDLPNAVSFFDMYGISKLKDFCVEERWRKNRTYENMKAMVGLKLGGVPCYLDVHEKYHGPHGLVAGTTGSGKSETLQTYMLSLAINFSPDDVGFFIIDYKGGGMANLFNGLPHILGQISNLSGNQVRRAMVSIKSENQRRQKLFNEHGVNNINAYTTLYKNGEISVPIPHLFIIIDEFAELKREQADFMKELISVAQVGRSLGVHLILATQKPSGTVDDNIWSNSKFRLCLRVQDRQDSMDMLHKADAAYLTQTGRAYLQVGNDELYELFQSGWSGAIYDENEMDAHKTLAVMLANTGKAALVGSHVRRKLHEEQKNLWIKTLCGYIDSADKQWNENQVNGADNLLTGEQFIERSIFETLRKQGMDYPENTTNHRALQALLQLYHRAKELGLIEKKKIASYIIETAAKQGTKLPEVKGKTQLDAIVQYLAKVAEKEGYRQPQQLWLPVLPEELVLESLEGYSEQTFRDGAWPQHTEKWDLKAFIGLCDDPMNQAQMPYSINFTECGHYAVCGISMSGKSTLLQTAIYGLIHSYSPEYLNVYILDFSNRMLSVFEREVHVGGVLYESDVDTIGKFIHMLENLVDERKKMFKGGNYSQYVMTHGVTCPAVLVVIDDIANFRAKTDYRFDDQIFQLIRESASYGIYFLISSAGFGTTEIPNRMRDHIHQTICLELQDKFAYGNCLNTMQLSVIPEPGIHGRGLVVLGGNALEFHTALAVTAPDDYKRSEKIREDCEELNQSWEGNAAKRIPKIPEKPLWHEFAELTEVKAKLADDRHLPLGFDLETADIYSVDLARNYCYLISGRPKSGKTNTLKVLLHSAKAKGGKLAVVEFGSTELQKVASEAQAEYIDTYEKYMEFMKKLVPVFQERNRIKKECLAQEMEEEEIYLRMQQETPWFIYITDLSEYTMQMHSEQGVKDNINGAMSNLFEKGYLHNIFFFACMQEDKRIDVLGKSVYEKFVSGKQGIHMGGNVASQKFFDFTGMSYSEQTATEKKGIGIAPPTESEPYHKVVIPMAKGWQGN